jgi:hypothetical protein
MFRTIGKHVPPPPEAKPPGLWGKEDYLGELIGDRADLKTEPGTVSMRFLSPEHFADFFITNYGPTLKAYESLGEDDRPALRSDLIELAKTKNRASDGTAVCDFDYIIAIATKR